MFIRLCEQPMNTLHHEIAIPYVLMFMNISVSIDAQIYMNSIPPALFMSCVSPPPALLMICGKSRDIIAQWQWWGRGNAYPFYTIFFWRHSSLENSTSNILRPKKYKICWRRHHAFETTKKFLKYELNFVGISFTAHWVAGKTSWRDHKCLGKFIDYLLINKHDRSTRIMYRIIQK
jgi:hypothetical protein